MNARLLFQSVALGAAACLPIEPVSASSLRVDAQVKIGVGSFPQFPENENSSFGAAVASLGDLDGPGPAAAAIAVGAPTDPAGGAVWILFLDATGSVLPAPEPVKIVNEERQSVRFGQAIAFLGDLDGPGGAAGAIAVGEIGDTDGIPKDSNGAIWILFLNPDGTVNLPRHKISSTAGGGVPLMRNDQLGEEITNLGDLDGIGPSQITIAAGAKGDDGDGDQNVGAVWILPLEIDFAPPREVTVGNATRIGDNSFGVDLASFDLFGEGLQALPDVNGDGTVDLAVGARGDDDAAGAGAGGATWILFLDAATDGTVSVIGHQKISDVSGGFNNTSPNFGSSVGSFGAIGADADPTIGVASVGGPPGRVWILQLEADGTVACQREVFENQCGFVGPQEESDHFGQGVDVIRDPDLNGDGVVDLVAGAPGAGPETQGAVWILFMSTTPCCPADTDGRCDVSIGDLLNVLADWSTDGVARGGDVNDDGTVDIGDLLFLLANWGPCPGFGP